MGKKYFSILEVSQVLGVDYNMLRKFCEKNDCCELYKYGDKNGSTEYIIPENLVTKIVKGKQDFFTAMFNSINASEVQ